MEAVLNFAPGTNQYLRPLHKLNLPPVLKKILGRLNR